MREKTGKIRCAARRISGGQEPSSARRAHAFKFPVLILICWPRPLRKSLFQSRVRFAFRSDICRQKDSQFAADHFSFGAKRRARNANPASRLPFRDARLRQLAKICPRRHEFPTFFSGLYGCMAVWLYGCNACKLQNCELRTVNCVL